MEAEKSQELQLAAGDPGQPLVWLQPEFKSKGRRKSMSQLEDREREQILPYSTFYSIQALKGLHGTHPHRGRQSGSI